MISLKCNNQRQRQDLGISAGLQMCPGSRSRICNVNFRQKKLKTKESLLLCVHNWTRWESSPIGKRHVLYISYLDPYSNSLGGLYLWATLLKIYVMEGIVLLSTPRDSPGAKLWSSALWYIMFSAHWQWCLWFKALFPCCRGVGETKEFR